jgi:hypothetical protein
MLLVMYVCVCVCVTSGILAEHCMFSVVNFQIQSVKGEEMNIYTNYLLVSFHALDMFSPCTSVIFSNTQKAF